tara:strand:- start:351 stop:1232 length:882 start_codon:yes stop_codon:yes gene_type:complete
MNTSDIHYIVFAGGAARGVVYASALDQFKIMTNYNFDTQLKGCAGTSIGAFFASALCTNKSMESILNIARTMNLMDLVSIDISNIFSSWSVDSGTRLHDWLRTYLGDFTFEDVKQKFGKVLKIAVSDISGCNSVIFQHTTHPTFLIAEAVYMSMSIPFLIPPNIINNKMFVDGGIMNNFPIEQFPIEYTLALHVVWGQNEKITSIETYITRLMYCSLKMVTETKLKHLGEEYKTRIITIDAGIVVHGLNMRLGEQERNGLFMAGRNAMYAYIKKNELKYIHHQTLINTSTQTE